MDLRFFLISLALLAGLHQAHGMDVRITGGEAGLHYVAEYNRALLFCWNVAATKTLELNSRHDVRVGIALGKVGDVFEIKWFAGGAVAPFSRIPVRFAVEYLYNGLPAFEYKSDTLRIMTSFEHRRWNAAIGPVFRFSSFFGECAIFEPDLSWSFNVFAINNDTLRLGAGLANFDDFVSRVIGGHFYNINALVRLNQRLALASEVRMYQSGSFVLASNFYGIEFRGGVFFSW